jgi:superfamily I DNA/RNA helicase
VATTNPNSVLRVLENALVDRDIPCYVPVSDDEQVSDEQIMAGKVAFLTFNSCKGLERKVAVVINFDVGYFNFFARDLNRQQCPSTLYVAATRAQEKLFLLAESEEGNHLPFLDRKLVDTMASRKRNPGVEVNPLVSV